MAEKHPGKQPRRFSGRYAGLLLLTLLGACAGPSAPPQSITTPSSGASASSAAISKDQVALRTLLDQQNRLYRVAAPLLVTNAGLCRAGARNLLGFTAKNKYSFPAELSKAAEKAGFGERLQVTGVLPDSGAQKSDVQVGDRLLAVADKSLPPGQDAEQRAAQLLGPLMLNARNGIKLMLERGTEPVSTTVPLTRACAYSIELGNTDNVNSYSDGRRILITQGMLDFTKTDEELAFVIAKEMAHSSLGHVQRQKMMAIAGGIIDNLTKTRPDSTTLSGSPALRPYPQDMDGNADTLSLYMLVRAGYKIDDAPAFWRRLATRYPASTPNSHTALHPSFASRMTVMERSLRTIKMKQETGKPLAP
ncbi:M48 family metalloprotease [Herbaspirillum sp. RTI4]|uniref:M48 family metalloprotease n=1 Tax=Herbaspirillum sp. RTI4 TaxID=3048640 RepID=UPI002AB3E25F|nr:M48 family metalloprotease [Herbaspirillum sp. RTI4]MDY7578162.1 M48 family metalloprotease [Herbaspirillum sp. RTI4]MEA9980751.1 M48 family metalloprotease [Herbaspirillum sp. RTI4]